MLAALRSFLAARRGSMTTEFAFVAPVLVLLTLGAVEIARFVLLSQKLDRIATATADLTAQGETISEAEIENMFDAAQQIANPFTLGAASRVILSGITAAGGNPPRVAWQRQGAGTLAETSHFGAQGANAVLPAGFIVRDGETAIVSEVFFEFAPFLMPDLVSASTLYHRALFRPRLGTLTSVQP